MALSLADGLPTVDQKNSTFWNELCGTGTAKALGITDRSEASLERFDRWYFDFYPYLENYIPFADLKGKDVLEVGLGYGTVASALMKGGARYHGLDIADGPVEMAAYRADLEGRDADIRQGSVLECPFDDQSFDYVVSIGCLHHTGDLARAIDEVHRVLKPGGGATIMVYHALSYRQWCLRPLATFRLAVSRDGKRPPLQIAEEKALDINQDGEAAPETAFVTKRQLQTLCARFETALIRQEHIHAELLFKKIPRAIALKLFGPWLGLNLYARLQKKPSADADEVNSQEIRRAS
ncbi:MAG: class I SAM-dependent methyltransferase [Geminicoccaceae bacterium]